MGRRGDAFDNAVAESFFATLETELLDRTSFATRNQARTAVFDYIEGWARNSGFPGRSPSCGSSDPIEPETHRHLWTSGEFWTG